MENEDYEDIREKEGDLFDWIAKIFGVSNNNNLIKKNDFIFSGWGSRLISELIGGLFGVVL